MKYKYNYNSKFIISLIPLILGILYIIFKYYIRTDYAMNNEKYTVFVTLVVISFFWWFAAIPYLNKHFY
jgi:hypothetical protein